MMQKRLPWKKIAAKFNEELGIPHYKKASQCCERWKNALTNKCKKHHFIFFQFEFYFTKPFK